jgi:regulator of replication initiation timing
MDKSALDQYKELYAAQDNIQSRLYALNEQTEALKVELQAVRHRLAGADIGAKATEDLAAAKSVETATTEVFTEKPSKKA